MKDVEKALRGISEKEREIKRLLRKGKNRYKIYEEMKDKLPDDLSAEEFEMRVKGIAEYLEI